MIIKLVLLRVSAADLKTEPNDTQLLDINFYIASTCSLKTSFLKKKTKKLYDPISVVKKMKPNSTPKDILWVE